MFKLINGNKVMTMELHPATSETEGYITMHLGDNVRVFTRLLRFEALSRLLQVLRGAEQSWFEECNGHGTEFAKCYKPEAEYSITFGTGDIGVRFTLNDAQAIGIEAAISGAMLYVVFGDPNKID